MRPRNLAKVLVNAVTAQVHLGAGNLAGLRTVQELDANGHDTRLAEADDAADRLVNSSLLRVFDRERRRFQLHALLGEQVRTVWNGNTRPIVAIPRSRLGEVV